MSDRPHHLVIVTHKGQDKLDLFSAHTSEQDANTVYKRLRSLLAGTERSVHLVAVPERDGVIDAPTAVLTPTFKPVETSKPKVVRKKLTQEEFEEETRAIIADGESAVLSDADASGFGEAFS